MNLEKNHLGWFENKAIVLGNHIALLTPINKSFLNTAQQTIFLILSILLFIALTIVSVLFYLYIKKKRELERIVNEKTKELLHEKENSERLLSKVLPKITADELRATGRAKTKRYKLATVLFCDIEGFTRIAEEMNPEALVDKLDTFYFQFDNVVDRFNIEKIKTIGDAYMCAGGIPQQNHTNPVEVILAALEMLRYMRELRKSESNIWDIRIGIHSGPIIAGVVGQKRLSYDIWGDTVNTASRMESSGEAGLINISENTFQMVKNFFQCDYRGKMPVKYKGNIKMYFVRSIKPGLFDSDPYVPNKAFNIQLQILRLEDLETEVVELMETHIPSTFTYHNIKHTIDIYSKTELYGNAEGLPDEDVLNLRTAALIADLSYFENHPVISTDYISTISLLKKFHYNEIQIIKIYEILECLNRPLRPENKIEKVFLDAEYDYLGRSDCILICQDLLSEVKQENPFISYTNWWKERLIFIEKFDFYSKTAQGLREIPKKEQLNRIKQIQN